jgi:hypothetical protein
MYPVECFSEITQPELIAELWLRLDTVLPSLYSTEAGYIFIKQAGWVAVPQEGYWQTNAENLARLLQALLKRGYRCLYALPTETLTPPLPIYQITVSSEGLDAFGSASGALNYVLFAGKPDWIGLFASDDFSVLAGEPDFVREVLGSDIAEAFSNYHAYAADPFWGRHGELLLYVHDQLSTYREAPLGSTIHIGPG